MLADGHWVRFTCRGERYALPVEAVAQVISIDRLKPTLVAGWAGVVTLPEGTLPLADGGELLGETDRQVAPGRGLVLRGRLPLAFTVDEVSGLIAGTACPLVGRVGMPAFAAAALPTADGTALVLDADQIWHKLRAALEPQGDRGGFRLRPLVVRERSAPVPLDVAVEQTAP